MAKTSRRKNEVKKHRFTPDGDGLNSLLDDFNLIWKLFESIADLVGTSPRVREFLGLKKTFILVSRIAVESDSEGPQSKCSHAISSGVALSHQIEDFLEEWAECAAANGRFDAMSKKVRELSEEVWGESESSILDARAAFMTAEAGDDLPLLINTCRNAEVLLRKTVARAKAKAEIAEKAKEVAARAAKKSELLKRLNSMATV